MIGYYVINAYSIVVFADNLVGGVPPTDPLSYMYRLDLAGFKTVFDDNQLGFNYLPAPETTVLAKYPAVPQNITPWMRHSLVTEDDPRLALDTSLEVSNLDRFTIQVPGKAPYTFVRNTMANGGLYRLQGFERVYAIYYDPTFMLDIKYCSVDDPYSQRSQACHTYYNDYMRTLS